ncbi:MAG: hypothetical protein B6226_06155 [Candidatus Cloacimonetes bacterium 4572_65]|nr:MAG: hypothetical protein B6226_06155 [Candidatus Cloacimonetes bacterium 4572_65]
MFYKELNSKNFIEELKGLNSKLDIPLIEQALILAEQLHLNQQRASGEPYLIHPLHVGYILGTIKADSQTICAGLLHDTLEDTSLDYETLSAQFGESIANLVEGVTKLDGFKSSSRKDWIHHQAENFRKLLLFTVKDVRVIIIKLADRLHNMRTIEYVEQEKKERIAKETLDIYVPLANRFGLAIIRWELEDICFKILQPDEYHAIVKAIDLKRSEREIYIQEVVAPVKSLIEEDSIAVEANGRSKHFYSIYRKHLKKSISYAEIYDLAAIRLITDSSDNCYRILGLLHSLFQPVDDRFKDYIARPKANQYQSLHTVVIGPEGRKVEFQIRTRAMHKIAEEGVAAHWVYKESSPVSFNLQIEAINSILNEQLDNPSEFLDSLKFNHTYDEIIVITPENDYIKLPVNSSPLDFAFAIHSDIGLSCSGARVNNKFVPLKTKLKTGDRVEIISSPQSKPSRDWLNLVKTSNARLNIKSYFKKIESAEVIFIGKELFEKRIRKSDFRVKSDEDILQLAKLFKISSISEFFASLGKGKISFADVLEILTKNNSENDTEEAEIIVENKPDSQGFHDVIFLDDISNLMLSYAKCCNPKPGDNILGYVTRGRGITIHKAECSDPNFLKLLEKESQRFFKISWNRAKNIVPSMKIDVSGYYNREIHFGIVELFNNFNLEILVNKFSSHGVEFKCHIQFVNNHFKNIKLLISYLKKLDGVSKVKIIK